jgi:hypothetical protein
MQKIKIGSNKKKLSLGLVPNMELGPSFSFFVIVELLLTTKEDRL